MRVSGAFLVASASLCVFVSATVLKRSPKVNEGHVPAMSRWISGASWLLQSPVQTSAVSKPQIPQRYGMPRLRFEANRGQTDSHVKFLLRGSSYSLFLTG